MFEITLGESVSELTTSVVKVEEKDGGWLVTMESSGKTNTRFEVNEKGVGMVFGEGREFAPPVPILKLPLRDTLSWEYEATPQKEKAIKTTFKVIREEEVKVPAGTFKASPPAPDHPAAAHLQAGQGADLPGQLPRKDRCQPTTELKQRHQEAEEGQDLQETLHPLPPSPNNEFTRPGPPPTLHAERT